MEVNLILWFNWILLHSTYFNQVVSFTHNSHSSKWSIFSHCHLVLILIYISPCYMINCLFSLKGTDHRHVAYWGLNAKKEGQWNEREGKPCMDMLSSWPSPQDLMLHHTGTFQELDEVHLRTFCREAFIHGLRATCHLSGPAGSCLKSVQNSPPPMVAARFIQKDLPWLTEAFLIKGWSSQV